MQAALASVLELELDEVPDFASFGGRFWPELWMWLAGRNLMMISIHNQPAGYQLMRVKSPRFEGLHHELVCYDGKPVHDPHPDGHCQHGGLVCYDVLYLLDPSKPVGTKVLLSWQDDLYRAIGDPPPPSTP